jgi:hypothetical protein
MANLNKTLLSLTDNELNGILSQAFLRNGEGDLLRIEWSIEWSGYGDDDIGYDITITDTEITGYRSWISVQEMDSDELLHKIQKAYAEFTHCQIQ